MTGEKEQTPNTASLEETDHKESIRQLWWTIGVTALALLIIGYYTL